MQYVLVIRHNDTIFSLAVSGNSETVAKEAERVEGNTLDWHVTGGYAWAHSVSRESRVFTIYPAKEMK